MLILTRRPVETIYIGDEVTVTVLGVVGNQVRFGIEAPRNIVIDRAEIHERKKRAAQAASHSTPAQAAVNGNGKGHGAPTSEEDLAEREVNGNVAHEAPATLTLRR